MAPDFYQVLGVGHEATGKEIRDAYRRLARQYHPDANPDRPDAAERFKELSAAYEVVSDPRKRARYDRHARRPGEAVEPDRYAPPAGGYPPRGHPGVSSAPGTWDEDLIDLTGLFSPFGRASRDEEASRFADSGRRGYRSWTPPARDSEDWWTCRLCGGEGRMSEEACPGCRGSTSLSGLISRMFSGFFSGRY